MCQFGARIIVEGVGGEEEVLFLQAYVEVEDGLACVGVVFAPVARQRIVFVDHLSPFKEIAEVVETVVVETVGVELGAPMGEDDVAAHTCKLVAAVVEGVFAVERQRIGLSQLDMSEGLERVGLLVEVGTVARQGGPFVAEAHLSLELLSVGSQSVLVVAELVGVLEIDALVGFLACLPLLTWSLVGCQC